MSNSTDYSLRQWDKLSTYNKDKLLEYTNKLVYGVWIWRDLWGNDLFWDVSMYKYPLDIHSQPNKY